MHWTWDFSEFEIALNDPSEFLTPDEYSTFHFRFQNSGSQNHQNISGPSFDPRFENSFKSFGPIDLTQFDLNPTYQPTIYFYF